MLTSYGADNLTESAVSGTVSPAPHDSLPSLGPGHMAFEIRHDGRIEKRLSIAIVVHLARVQDRRVNGAELTHTDNISAHGARALSNCPWQPGEVVHVTSLKDETPIRGKVAYCQKLGDKRYSIGLNFNGNGVTWSAFRAYAGT